MSAPKSTLPGRTAPDSGGRYFVQIPGQDHWIPASGLDEGVLIMAAEVERLRAALDEAAYALFELKRTPPERVREKVAAAHERAAAALDASPTGRA